MIDWGVGLTIGLLAVAAVFAWLKGRASGRAAAEAEARAWARALEAKQRDDAATRRALDEQAANAKRDTELRRPAGESVTDAMRRGGKRP